MTFIANQNLVRKAHKLRSVSKGTRHGEQVLSIHDAPSASRSAAISVTRPLCIIHRTHVLYPPQPNPVRSAGIRPNSLTRNLLPLIALLYECPYHCASNLCPLVRREHAHVSVPDNVLDVGKESRTRNWLGWSLMLSGGGDKNGGSDVRGRMLQWFDEVNDCLGAAATGGVSMYIGGGGAQDRHVPFSTKILRTRSHVAAPSISARSTAPLRYFYLGRNEELERHVIAVFQRCPPQGKNGEDTRLPNAVHRCVSPSATSVSPRVAVPERNPSRQQIWRHSPSTTEASRTHG
ncbi:hypothetical protein BJ912DRAFT_1060592 [Pholiota molesta]|nr:hypothetical protein BJ912DRAFT_1060592 [Pholiota molesta]